MREIRGQCHCGNITFEFVWAGDSDVIPVRACSCSFCTKHGGVYTSHPQGRLSVRIDNHEQVHRYQFGTRTAEFHVCARCGVVPLVTSTIEGTCYAVVNVNTFEDLDRSDLDASITDFDGEGVDDRLARRRRNWIPDVRFET